MLSKIPTFSISLVLLTFLVSGAQCRRIQTQIIPNTVSNTTSKVQFTSLQNAFEAPHVSPIDSNSFEWWWFSVSSADSTAALAIIFFTTSIDAFPLTGVSPDILSINIQAVFPNGTQYYNVLPVDSATVQWDGRLGNGVYGRFDGPAPSTFSGTSDLKTFTVEVDAPDLGVQGCITFTSKAPAHYPCTSDTSPGQGLDFILHIGWANAIPSAKAVGTFTLGGTSLAFNNALGYHDMNWGDMPFPELVQSWYWGHATLGPYTVVFFDAIDSNGDEKVSAYIANDGKVLLASCDAGSVSVRPGGRAALYPPTSKHGKFGYLHVVFALGEETFVLNVTKTAEVVSAPGFYYRWIGRAKGGLVGEQAYEGPTEFEEFTVQ